MATLPPWLTPARPAPLYATGLGLGLRAAEQQAAIAQRAQAMAAQAAAQQNEALLQAQRMAVQQEMAGQEMAIKQQEMGMRAEELGISRDELAMRNAFQQMKIEEASRLQSAQREYQRRVAAGEPAENVLAEMGPGVGADSAFAALIRERAAPAEVGIPGGPVQGQPVMGPEGKAIPGMIAVPSSTGKGYVVHPVRPETTGMSEYQRASLADRVQRQIDKLYETNSDLALEAPDPTWTARRKASYTSGRKSISALENRIQSLEGGGSAMRAATTGQAALPMPRTKAEAVKGQLYETRMGVMEWDGTKFVAPSTNTETYDER